MSISHIALDSAPWQGTQRSGERGLCVEQITRTGLEPAPQAEHADHNVGLRGPAD